MTEQPRNVRLANPSDEDRIYKVLSEGLFQENGTFSLSEERAREFIRQAINHEGGIIGIIEEGGEIAGSIGMNLGRFWYSDDWHIEEYWNFVSQPYRNHRSQDGKNITRSFYAEDLINFAKWVSERMNMVLNIGIISTTRTEAKCRLYSRNLQNVGQFFMYNIEMAKGPGINKEILVVKR